MVDSSSVPAWRRTARYCHHLVQTDERLEQLRQVRGAGITVHAHERAIWLAAMRSVDRGGWDIEEKIEGPEWWMPLTRRRAHEIVDELVERLLARCRKQDP